MVENCVLRDPSNSMGSTSSNIDPTYLAYWWIVGKMARSGRSRNYTILLVMQEHTMGWLYEKKSSDNGKGYWRMDELRCR